MSAYDDIKEMIKKTDRMYASVRDWSNKSENGRLKIDMGVMTTLKLLIKKTGYSETTVRNVVKTLIKEEFVTIYSYGKYCPMCIFLKESNT